MSPENTHKLMILYIEVLIPGVILQYIYSFCFYKPFPIGRKVRVKLFLMVGKELTQTKI